MEEMPADQKLWHIPEVVERMLSLLDPASALCLVQSGLLSKDILQKSLSCRAWREIIKRISRDENEMSETEEVRHLLEILKLMELEEPITLLLPLLHLVCDDYESGFDFLVMVCPCRPEPHCVYPAGFLLLEEIEGALGSTEQSIESIELDSLEDQPEGHLLKAIGSRLSRQKETVTSLNAQEIHMQDRSSVEAFIALLQAQSVSVGNMNVYEAIGEEGWQELARALKSKPDIGLKFAYIPRKAFAEARKDDMKDIWDATENGFWVCGDGSGSGCLFVAKSESSCTSSEAFWTTSIRYDWEPAWTRLKQISDVTEDEFKAELRLQDKRWSEERKKDHEKEDSSDEGDRSEEEKEYEDSDSNADENEGEESEEGEIYGEKAGEEAEDVEEEEEKEEDEEGEEEGEERQ